MLATAAHQLNVNTKMTYMMMIFIQMATIMLNQRLNVKKFNHLTTKKNQNL
jgi:hypothetical protein